MKAKRLLSLLMTGFLFLNVAGEVHAQENVENKETETVVWEETAPAPTMSTDGISPRASWGYGNITSSKPLGGYPKAKANTYTYSGTAYRMSARIDVINSDSVSTIGPEKTGYNVSSVSTNYLVSDTKKCFFIGHHEIQDTKSSSTQTATSEKSYD